MSKQLMASAALIGALWLGGCATQKYVDEHVAALQTTVQGQVSDVQAHAQQQDTQLAQLDQATRDAMARAEAAGRLAEGKFVYEMVLSDDSVKFPVSGTELSQEAQTRLNELAQKLKADNKNVYLEIQGHTDNTGSDATNLRLGEERADAVRLYMNQQGVPLNRMATISYGDTAPAAPNTTREGRAQNRRVVVIVMA
jgi:peptidoglycan-associated lipoprotein